MFPTEQQHLHAKRANVRHRQSVGDHVVMAFLGTSDINNAPLSDLHVVVAITPKWDLLQGPSTTDSWQVRQNEDGGRK